MGLRPPRYAQPSVLDRLPAPCMGDDIRPNAGNILMRHRIIQSGTFFREAIRVLTLIVAP
jgi:hypothetical protein